LSENEVRKKKKKKTKFVDRDYITKKKTVEETKEVVKEEKIKEYQVKDLRDKKVEDKVSIVESTEEEKTEEYTEYGNYMYDVLVDRSEEKITYRTEPKKQKIDDYPLDSYRNNNYDDIEIRENKDLTTYDSQPKKYYGQVQNKTDYEKVVSVIKGLENRQNENNESLVSEFKSLSKEMKVYIIDNIIANNFDN
jgi:hypothetical protein